MTSRDFAYWLQGYFEIAKPATIDNEGVTLIQQHLNMVFVHEIDPSHGGPEEQAKLSVIHNPAPSHPSTMAEITAYNEEAKANGRPLMRC